MDGPRTKLKYATKLDISLRQSDLIVVIANVIYAADGSVRYRSRPESHLAPYVVDTGNINADEAMVIG